MIEKKLMTRQQVAEMLSISVDTLDDLRRRNLIRAVSIGARVYFTPEELDAFVKRLVKNGRDM